MKFIKMLSMILVIVGALNWGLVGLFGFNLVTALFGEMFLAKLIYVLVGLAGVHQLIALFTCGSCCNKS